MRLLSTSTMENELLSTRTMQMTLLSTRTMQMRVLSTSTIAEDGDDKHKNNANEVAKPKNNDK